MKATIPDPTPTRSSTGPPPVDAIRAQRFDRERRRERGIDAAREADDDVAEAVLRHVVAEPELECEPHLLELRQLLRGRRVGR